MASMADLSREATRDAKRREMTHDDSFRRGQDLMRDTVAKSGKRVRNVVGAIDGGMAALGDLLLPKADLGSRYTIGYDQPTGQWEQVGDSPESAELKTMAALFPTGSLSDAVQGGKAILRTFGGMRAKTADLEAQRLAEALEAKGVAPEKIWQDTGWYRAPWDQKWRFEIDDSGAKQKSSAQKTGTLPLDKWMPHAGLNAAYPERFRNDLSWGDTMFSADPKLKAAGEYDAPRFSVRVRGDLKGDDRKSATLHELQHLVQDQEGFAKGGTIGYGITREQYPRLAGEAEARAVQARMNLTPEQRRARFPLEDFDVKPEDMIVRYGDGPAMSVPTDYSSLAIGAPEFRAASMTELQDALSRMRARNVDKGLDEDIATGAIRDEIARRNAVEMLGLPEGNTAADRAAAMGFDTPAYHGTHADIPSFIPNEALGGSVFTAPTHQGAAPFAYAKGANIIPLATNQSNMMPGIVHAADEAKKALSARKRGKAGYMVSDAPRPRNDDVNAAFVDPSRIRSRFAAFDPKLRDSANLLAANPYGLSPYALTNQDSEPRLTMADLYRLRY